MIKLVTKKFQGNNKYNILMLYYNIENTQFQTKWINRQRVLVFAARGTTQRDRHLMNDLKTIMPHGKAENKISRRENLAVINEVRTLSS